MKRSTFPWPYSTHTGEKFLSPTTQCCMTHITFIDLFMLLQTFSLYIISNPNSLSSHSKMLPAGMHNQIYFHTGIPRNPQDARQCNTYVQHRQAAGIVQLDISTRYELDGPGFESWWGARFSRSTQTGLEAHPPSCPGGKATGA